MVSLNGLLDVSLRIARCWGASGESRIWSIYRGATLPSGLIFAVRLNEENDRMNDCLLVPTDEMPKMKLRVSDRSIARFRRYSNVEAGIRSLLRRVSSLSPLEAG